MASLAAAQAQTPDPTALRPADIIDVVVLGQPTLSADFVVDKDGAISYPLIGRVEVAGLAPGDLAKKLQALLGNGFIRRPEVSVRVKEYRSRPVLVLGEVARPGIFALKGDRALLTILAEAGGLTTNAGHELLVARPPEGAESRAIQQFTSMPIVPGLSDVAPISDTEELPPGALPGSDVFRASFRELMKGKPEQNVILEGGDLIFVPRAAQIFITGQAASDHPQVHRRDDGPGRPAASGRRLRARIDEAAEGHSFRGRQASRGQGAADRPPQAGRYLEYRRTILLSREQRSSGETA